MSPAPDFLCIGAAHWDVIARAAQPLGPGADVPGRVRRRPGGVALNIALALARGGARTGLLAHVGRDAAGEALAALAAAAGVETGCLTRGAAPTDSYLAIEAADGALFAAVADCAGLEAAGTDLLAPLGRGRMPGIAVADGNLAPAVLDALAGRARALALVPASPAKAAALAPFVRRAAPRLYLNLREAEALTGRRAASAAEAAAAAVAAGAAQALVTDGPRTAAFHGPGGRAAALPRPAAGGETGAGDALAAAHLLAERAGLGARDALAAALDAAAAHLGGDAPAEARP